MKEEKSVKDLPGTYSNNFDLRFNSNFFEQKSILNTTNSEIIITKVYKVSILKRILLKLGFSSEIAEGCFYGACTPIVGEELELAVKHFKFLRKYNLA